MGSSCLIGIEFRFVMMRELFRWMVVMIEKDANAPLNYTLKMVKMANFMLHIFYHNLKNYIKKPLKYTL